MKTTIQQTSDRRQKVVSSMAKKFADHENVEQIIITHRKKLIQRGNTLYIIIAVTVVSIIISILVTAGIVQPSLPGAMKTPSALQIKNSIDILIADLDAGTISPDQFVLFCKDYLIRYDSLPPRYKTPFSTTSSSEVYGTIVDVWPALSLRTRQKMLRELPRIETEQRRRNRETAPASSR